MTKLYDELASWWPLVSAPADYEEEAGFYLQSLTAAGVPREVLELGSGGGNNASHLKKHFTMTLVDRSPGMLATSRALNTDCEHVEADMRDVRLGREFDAVFIHDALDYLTSEEDLARALETAYVHCRPGGVAVLAPDHFRETFKARADCGGHDGDGRALRYLEWSYDPDPSDSLCTTQYAFLLREGGQVRVVHDEHEGGLFSRETWLALCREAGFEPEMQSYRHSEVEADLEVILCRKPGAGG